MTTSKKFYRKNYFKGFLKNYFGNSYMALTSFFTKEQDLSLDELEEIKKMIEQEIDQKSDKETEDFQEKLNKLMSSLNGAGSVRVKRLP